jgi:glycosyltransferase
MKLSVITIVWNAEHHIERTIRSVLALEGVEMEYLVIDGGSTDGTMAIVDRYRDRITTIVSEPDKGISDAWNKGLALATGDVIALLNAGDTHEPGAAAIALEGIERGADVTYGITDLVSEDGTVLMRNPGRFHPWKYSAGLGLYHPSCFVRASLYRQVGGFDLRYRYAMDTDWMLRALRHGAKFRRVESLTRMLDDGVSVKNRFLAYGEHLQSLSQNMPLRYTYLSMLSTGLRGLARLVVRRIA